MKIKPSVCIVTSPRAKASIQPLAHIIYIFSELTRYLYLITGNEGQQIFKMNHPPFGVSIQHYSYNNRIIRAIRHIMLQIRISYEIILVNQKIDIYVFFCAEGFLLPLLTCKIFRKPVIVSLAGFYAQLIADNKGIDSRISVLLESISFELADKMVLYSPRLLETWHLKKYSKKIFFAHEHYLDFNNFKTIQSFLTRERIIGYVGRLSEEKGIINFIETIPQLLDLQPDLGFIIAGEGPLEDTVCELLLKLKLGNKVSYLGWIDYIQLPALFNKLKLLVIPSYTEGLPNVMLEAMAQGVVPVVSHLRGVTDFVILNGYSGFLIPSFDEKLFAQAILNRAMDSDLLENMSKNAWEVARTRFSCETMGRKYWDLFNIASAKNKNFARSQNLDLSLLGDFPYAPVMLVRPIRKLLRMFGLFKERKQHPYLYSLPKEGEIRK